MAKLPDPPTPDALKQISPRWHRLAAGTELWRIYTRGGPYPTDWNEFRAFGPTNNRFDHHLDPLGTQDRRIFYGAPQILTCIAEVFQDTGFVDPHENDRWLVGFAIGGPVRLLNLRGHWPTRAGASMALNTGERSKARAWSRAIYAAYPDADGLWYASSMNAHAPAVALYERAEGAIPPTPSFHRALADPLLRRVLEQAAHVLNYGIGV